jgi:tRNA dimethylallyltransferase
MKVIIISGPTATGKTNLAIDLAKKFGGEIVNFDSLLFYNEIKIGTAKPTQAEREQVPHHMIDIRSISQPMNAADFAKEAHQIIEKILKKNVPVYLVGGSGFYLQALLKGMFNSQTTPREILQLSNELYFQKGISPFLEILEKHDMKSFERYHVNDHYRIRRAVEHWWTTNTPISDSRKNKNEENSKMEGISIHGWNTLHVHIDLPKEDHLKIIENRTNGMIQDGLIDEVKLILSHGFSGLEKPLQSIGYKQSIDYLNGVYKSLDECILQIIIATRQLAKSQRTWFKKDKSLFTII